MTPIRLFRQPKNRKHRRKKHRKKISLFIELSKIKLWLLLDTPPIVIKQVQKITVVPLLGFYANSVEL